MSVLLGVAAIATLPAAIELARRSARVSLLDAAYAVPLAFVLGLVALVMGRRARQNLRWLRLGDEGTGAARLGMSLGFVAVCIALVAGLSVGFYEAWLVYEHHR